MNPVALRKRKSPSPVVLSVSVLPPCQATREQVYARTRELAVKAGRSPLQVSQADYERARCELTGEADMTRQEAVLDTPPVARLETEVRENADACAATQGVS